uniref:DUF1345 domain-containing protein n=1 Tax=Thermogemmatispora argillosa TaxID=2045280 RepID=A0A455SZG2_9CHLR|nr:hypothetical protein KTA_04910 [Thermogemmatispora argillosa]
MEEEHDKPHGVPGPQRVEGEQRQTEGPSKIAPRWLALIAALLCGFLYAILPPWLTLGPNWLPLTLEGIIAAVVVAFSLLARLGGQPLPHRLLRRLALGLLAIVTLALGSAVALLIFNLPRDTRADVLLRAAALLWVSNILVFALWYWEVDGGGPVGRHRRGHRAVDFLFPQQAGGNSGGWVPHFLDYLFLAFTTATAFSPTDTMPLTRRAKTLMMLEALLSLLVLAILAARAINIL